MLALDAVGARGVFRAVRLVIERRAVDLHAPREAPRIVFHAAVDELFGPFRGALRGDAQAASGSAGSSDTLLFGRAADDGRLVLAQPSTAIIATLLALTVLYRVAAQILEAQLSYIAAGLATQGLGLVACCLTVTFW